MAISITDIKSGIDAEKVKIVALEAENTASQAAIDANNVTIAVHKANMTKLQKEAATLLEFDTTGVATTFGDDDKATATIAGNGVITIPA